MNADQPSLDILARLIDGAKSAGADSADALLFESTSISVAQRLGEQEKLEHAESCDLGLRVFIGKQQAVVSTTDFAPATLDALVERAVAMAKTAPEDPYCGIAEHGRTATEIPDLDSCDPFEPTAGALLEAAAACEDAARAVKGITNSEGAEAGWGKAGVTLAASNGLAASYAGSSTSISAAVLAGEGTTMERDYDYATAVYGADLRSPKDIGTSAGKRTVERLGARKMKTAQVPVIYDPRISGGLVRHLMSAANGVSVARGTSFLKDSMDTQVMSDGIDIIDDPLRPRGLRSKPFDGEGIATRTKAVVENGVLKTWLMDLASARQLGLETTGNAARGTGGPPTPAATNAYMKPGKVTPAELIGVIDNGFYVTELIGMGINMVTGDYSRGATGFWIENGEIAYPVSEMTVAGNLKDMFKALTPADDLVFRFGTDAPTIRIDGLTVAGE